MIHRVITYTEKWQHFQCMSGDRQHRNDSHQKHTAISETRHVYNSCYLN